MSVKDNFRQAWKAKFPTQAPPELHCLERISSGTPTSEQFYSESASIDISAVGQGLQKCNETIADLNRQLREQEFIASFLWDLFHGVKRNPSVKCAVQKSPSVVSEKKDLGEEETELNIAIPIQDPQFVSTSPNGTPENPPEVPDISLIPKAKFEKRVSNNIFKKQFSAGNDLDDPKPFVSERKNSLPLLDDQSPSAYMEDEERTYSADLSYIIQRQRGSGSLRVRSPPTLTTFKPTLDDSSIHENIYKKKPSKPIPAPRISLLKPQNELSTPTGTPPDEKFSGRIVPNPAVNPGFEVLESKTLGADLLPAAKPAIPLPMKKPTIVVNMDSGGGAFANKKLLSHSTKSRSPNVNVAIKTNSSFDAKKLSSHRRITTEEASSPGTPAANESGSSGGSPTSDTSSPRSRRRQRQPDYEEATPVAREFIEAAEASSDDEDEPIYYNMMLMKQQELNRAKTWYNKGGRQKHTKEPASNDGNRTGATKHWEPLNDSGLSSDSVRSVGSDSVFDDKPGSWRKRRSLLRATESTDSQSESEDNLIVDLPLCPEDEKLQMRRWVVSSILDSEYSYLGILDILMQYMTTFKNVLGTPQTIIPLTDIEVIFNKIPDLHHAHKLFVHDLSPKVEQWSADQQVAEIFQTLAMTEYTVAPDFLKNYQKAVLTIHRCWQENVQFAALTREIQVKNMKEKPSLEELLHKPVLRFQRNTLVLHDLIKCTPTSHTDYDMLQKTLQIAHKFLEDLEGPMDKDKAESQRYLAKQGLIVEKVGDTRKLRHIFLFNDVLVCARQKISTKQKIHLEPKWYISLMDLTLDDIVCIEEEKLMADCQQAEIESLQRKVSELQTELKSEIKLSRGASDAQRQWSFHNRSKNLEKIKKKLMEQQVAMIKASPRLLFRVHNHRNKSRYTLLMASDYERSNWRSTIVGLLGRGDIVVAQSSVQLSSAELQNLLNSQKITKVNMLGGLVGFEDLSMEEEHLFGVLNVKILKLQGLKSSADTYCTVEVDTFGHFFLKARTKVVSNSIEPVWNEDFDIDLEGAQTLRILCYKMGKDVGSLIGTCALEMSKAWLRGDFIEKPISLNDEISLIVSLRYSSRDQTLKRTLSTAKGSVFGAHIRQVAKREGTSIPLVVSTCVQEVESRGMQEIGIYRVSGVSGEIQRLKKSFDKNSRAAVQAIKEVDINVITGVLKLYFRELPEALFTDNLYPHFMKGMGLSDPEAKEKFIISILQSLPQPNRSTINFLMNHLIKVASHEQDNKMTLQNLATVFGPTLLRPAAKESQQQTLEELFSAGTRDVMMQTSMLLCFLNIWGRVTL